MSSGRAFRFLLAGFMLAVLQSSLRGQSGAAVELITVTPGGVAGGAESFLDEPNLSGTGSTNISADNRFVVFSSASADLVPGDLNGFQDVFIRDRLTGVTALVSVNSSGGQGNRQSGQPVISADGRFVAFVSVASNLVPGDTNRVFDSLGNLIADGMDIFVRDLQTQTTTRASVSSAGAEAEFGVHNIAPAISADGRYVAFTTLSRNLAPGDTDNFNLDVFVHDMATGATERASVQADGTEIIGADAFDPSISADGGRVAFTVFDNTLNGPAPTLPPNLPRGVYVRDLDHGQTILVSAHPDGTPATFVISDFAMISASGRYVSFANWEDLDPANPDWDEEELLDGPFADIFVRDLQTGTTRRASVPFPGGRAEESGRISKISGDGRFVAYGNGHDMVVRDMVGNRSVVVRAPDGSSPPIFNLTLSQDGRFAFAESYTDLVANDVNGIIDAYLFPVPPSGGADLSLTLTASTTQPAPDSDVTLTISVANAGGEDASGISVAIPLPAGLSYVSSTGDGALAGTTWSIPSLAAGATATIQIVAHVNGLSPLTANAEIMTAAPFDPDSTPGNGNPLEDDQQRLVLTPQAIDLALALTANTLTPPVNSNVTLTLALANTGTITATGVAARLPLPAGLSFISSSGTGTYDPATGVWTAGAIAVGASPTHRIVARVLAAAPIDLSSEVITANGVDRDSTPNNNVATEDDQSSVHLAPAANTGIIVNDPTATVDGNDGKCSLVEAIIAANSDAPSGNAAGECAGGSGPDVIHLRALTPDYVFTTAHNTLRGPNALPPIASDITIDGAGAVVRRGFAAAPPFRLFVVDASGRLVLDHVDVRSGSATTGFPLEGQFGGAIYNAGRLEIVGGAVSNSAAACDGGGIFSVGPLVVRDSATIFNNMSGCSGGGIATFFATSVSVVDSTIEGNVASEGGGGLFIHGTTTATVSGSRIRNNHARAEGGGVFTHNGDANLTIARTEIRNNSAGTHGGGISNGRFDATGTSFIAGGTLSITNSTIASNSATGFGGGIASAGPLTVTTSAIDNNAISGPAAGCGGGIYSTSSLTMIAPAVGGNRASLGGGICAIGQHVRVAGGRISGNASAASGGGILIGWARWVIPAAGPRSVQLIDLTIEDNALTTAIGGGGGGVAAYLQPADVLTIDHALIRRNTSAAYGGGIAVVGGKSTLRNDSQIRENVAASAGGGILFQHFGNADTLTIEGGILDANVASGGGAIFNIESPSAVLTLTNVAMTNNRAPTGTGGAILNYGRMTVSGGVMRANSATSGGAIAIIGGSLSDTWANVGGTLIEDNVASLGGGIYTNESVGSRAVVTTLNGVTLRGNRAASGGGIFVRPNTTANLLSGTTVSGNVATMWGGGVYSAGVLAATEVTLSSNRADEGGGIYAVGESTISRSTIFANTARIGAGGQNHGYFTMFNSTISGNVASAGAGGLDVVGRATPGGGLSGITLITRTTIAGNVGSPGGIANAGSIVQTDQTILAGNRRPDTTVSECTSTPGALATGLFNPIDTIVGVDPACALYQVALVSPQNAAFGLRTIAANAVFASLVGPLADNGGPTLTHALLPGSLAIDAVVDRGPAGACAVDQRGLARPIDGDGDGRAGCDVGAVEQQRALPSTPAVLSNLSPSTATIGAGVTSITINGSGFTAATVALWNGSPRATFASSATRLTVDLLPGDVASAQDITTALVTAVNPGAGASNALAFTLVSSRVASAGSLAVAPGTSATAAGIGIIATLTNNGASSPTATLTIASYSSNPATGTIFAAGGFYDLQITGADASDSVAASFYYPFTITGAAETALQLLYWTGSAWAPVIGSGGAGPFKDTTDNVDGVLLAGGKFSVTLDATSTPAITALGGTVFAIAAVQTAQPGITGEGSNHPGMCGGRATFTIHVSGVSATPGALNYSCPRQKISAHSRTVSSYAVDGRTVTFGGAMKLNGQDGYTYTATARVGSPSTFALVIKRADGTVYFSAPALPLTTGSFRFMPRARPHVKPRRHPGAYSRSTSFSSDDSSSAKRPRPLGISRMSGLF